MLFLNGGYCNRTNKKAVEKTSLPPANLSAIIWTLLPSTFQSLLFLLLFLYPYYYYLSSVQHSILFLLLNFHEFLLFSVFPDTFLLFPLVALSMCYSVVPRYDPYNVFLFVIIVATGVNLLVNNFVTTNLYLFSYVKHNKRR